MKKLIKTHYAYILIFAFIVISGFSLFMCCDDYIWFFAFSDDSLSSYASPNGRYLTNFITRFSVQCLPLYSVFYIISFGLLVILLEKLVRKKNIPVSVSLLSVFILIQLIPSKTYAEVIRWISGFNNYCFAFIFTLIYIIFTFKMLFNEHMPKPYTAPLLLILGFAGCLCVEHLTVYNIMFCIFAIAAMIIRKKKLSLHHLCYLAGAVSGAVLMFSHGQYHTIASDSDDIGTRSIEFSFADSLMQTFRFVLPHFCKDFWILHLVVTAAFTVFYIRNRFEKKPKYAGICIWGCWLFAAYLLFTSVFQDIAVLSTAMKGRAIELALTFLYICALMYNTAVYLKNSERIRAFVYILSSVSLTLPFAVASPVTARCFFIEYLFWILFALEVTFDAMSGVRRSELEIVKNISTCIACCIFIIFANMNITNCYYDHVRYRILQEQMETDTHVVDLLILPYQKYAYDDMKVNFDFFASEDKVSHCRYALKYYGISYSDLKSRTRRTIEAMDYNQSKELE